MIIRWLTFIIITLFFVSITIVANAKKIDTALGEKFRLEKGDTAHIREINAELYLIGFTYSTCPKDVDCLRSGHPVVHYEFRANGKRYTDSAPLPIPYEIDVGPSDFKTFSEFIIWDSIERCKQKNDATLPKYKKDECWLRLASRVYDVEYCRNIQDRGWKDTCIENLLDKIDDPELCDEVETPRMFCKYRQAVMKLNPDMCKDVIKWDYAIRCYKEISEITGEGIAICDRISATEKDAIKLCRDSIAGKKSIK